MGMIEFAIIAIIVLVFAGMLIALVVSQKASQRSQALALIRGGSSGAAKGGKKDIHDQRRAEIAKKLKEQSEEEKKKKKGKGASMADQLAQAGMKISVKAFWINMVIVAAIVGAVAWFAKLPVYAVPMISLVVLFLVPRMLIKIRTGKRQKKFLEEFPDALEAMIRLLKAGMPVSEAISMVGREFSGPVGEEMAKIYDTQKIGVPLHEACYEAARRMPITEMQMFATGIAIQAQTGASLSEVLGNLAHVIRARFRLKRKVVSLSSEAKSSAMIIGALPVLISGGIYLINPDYIGILFEDPFGRVLVGGAAVWMCIGILVMKIMINFKV